MASQTAPTTPAPTLAQLDRLAQQTLARSDTASVELVALLYGSLVSQILQDCGNDTDTANAELEKIGEKIGLRLVDEFLSKTTNIMANFLRQGCNSTNVCNTFFTSRKIIPVLD